MSEPQPYDPLTHEYVSDALLRRVAIAMWDADDAGRIADGEADMIMPRDNQQVMSEYLGHASAALAALRAPDRRDRDELTDRDDLTELLMLNQPLYPAVMARHLYERMATAIIAAGWVHWPHECGPEAEKNEKWQRSEGYDAGYAAGYRAARQLDREQRDSDGNYPEQFRGVREP